VSLKTLRITKTWNCKIAVKMGQWNNKNPEKGGRDMNARKEAEERSCAHLGEMAEAEMAAKLCDRYARHGELPAEALDSALADIENDIADFERSPTGDSTRNALALGLVRRVFVTRLRTMGERVRAARAAGAGIMVERLRA
jgi:hypothetical protein